MLWVGKHYRPHGIARLAVGQKWPPFYGMALDECPSTSGHLTPPPGPQRQATVKCQLSTANCQHCQLPTRQAAPLLPGAWGQPHIQIQPGRPRRNTATLPRPSPPGGICVAGRKGLGRGAPGRAGRGSDTPGGCGAGWAVCVPGTPAPRSLFLPPPHPPR